jgi:hypothetical protein
MVREISTVQSHGGRKDWWEPQVLKKFIWWKEGLVGTSSSQEYEGRVFMATNIR